MPRIELVGELDLDLLRIGLKAGFQVEATADPVNTKGAMNFKHHHNGTSYDCVVWPCNYRFAISGEGKELFITGLEGETIRVVNLTEGLAQAEAFCQMHERCKKDCPTNPDVIYFEGAHRYWQHILNELKKINPNSIKHGRKS